MKIRLIFITLISLIISFGADVCPQQARVPKSQFKDQKPPLEIPRQIFSKIEEGISLKEIDKFSEFLGAQTYLSLPNGIQGYYSPDHVFYILQDYFRIYKPVNFRFLTMNEKSDNPFASGVYRFESRGIRGTAQIYISLKQIGNNWKISLITIN